MALAHVVGERLIEGDRARSPRTVSWLEQADVLERSGDAGHARPDRSSCRSSGFRPARTSPSVGLYTPVSRLNTVVLPAPLGPIRPMSSPLLMVHVEVGHGFQTAEGDAEMFGFEDGLGCVAHREASFTVLSSDWSCCLALAAGFAPLPAAPRNSMRLTRRGSENSQDPKMPCGRKIMTSTSTTE